MSESSASAPLVDPVVHFSHPAYQFEARFAAREPQQRYFQTATREALRERLGETDVLVISGFWNNELLELAPKLKFIQACAVGFDQFDQQALKARGVRLANGRGINANAVSEHALGLMLALTRQLGSGRDNQQRKFWRPMIADLSQREDEVTGKKALIFGAGTIGSRVGRVLQALDVEVVGFKRHPNEIETGFDKVLTPDRFDAELPSADFVFLTCPLNDQTRNLMNASRFASMRPGAFLINVARGGCVDEAALVEALRTARLAGAALDVTATEPLPDDSPLWSLDNVLLTPHTGGETRRYEDNVIDILLENLARLARGERDLVSQVV